jgi:hypothetical protein
MAFYFHGTRTPEPPRGVLFARSRHASSRARVGREESCQQSPSGSAGSSAQADGVQSHFEGSAVGLRRRRDGNGPERQLRDKEAGSGIPLACLLTECGCESQAKRCQQAATAHWHACAHTSLRAYSVCGPLRLRERRNALCALSKEGGGRRKKKRGSA